MTFSTNLLVMVCRLWWHLSFRRRYQITLLAGLMMLSAFLEIISLGAVLPFLAVLTSPHRIFDYPIVGGVTQSMGLTSPKELLLFLTVLFVTAAITAAAIRMLVLWISLRLGLASASELSIEIYRYTLYQPYQEHLSRNSSEAIANITHNINGVAYGVLQPALTLVSSVVILSAITITIIVIDPMVALVSIIGFGVSYVLLARMVRARLKINGEKIIVEQTQVLKALQEGLGGFRDVLLHGVQSVYCDVYRRADRSLRLAEGDSQFITASPRYVMEAFGIALIASLAYLLSMRPGGIGVSLPILGALALGAQRLLPSLQQAYGAWGTMVRYQPALEEVLVILNQPLPKEADLPPPTPLPLEKSIRFVNIRFRYAENKPWVLDGLNLEVPRGTRVGIVGSTGCGKSTFLDLLMGLLPPTEGEMWVDDKIIKGKNLRTWQCAIAHVPQHIYLMDASIAENIAFGVPQKDIDMKRVRLAASQAQISSFIESSDEGYDALVGERGIRLSGGQRQRVGIARAFYRQANVLVFDEATSALDSQTEQSVMEAIEGLSSNLTIFLIAHRLTTVKKCDIIVVLEQGRFVAQGTYKELVSRNLHFKQMVLAQQ